MALDIAAIQHLYGANTSYRTGNDVYVLPDANVAGIGWTCIWDAGGIDEMRYNGKRNAILDLTAATLDNSATGGGVLSYAANIYGGFTIANGVVIEKATGGSGDDTIVGNAANNTLVGNVGNDSIRGGLGNDIINGGNGDDYLRGEAGIDKIEGGAGADTATYSEQTKSIVVTLNGATYVTVKIGADTDPADRDGDDDTIRNVENIDGGKGNDTITGDGLANVIWGNAGNDTLDGGAGIDTVDYTEKKEAVILTLTTGDTYATVKVGATAEDNIRNFENVLGGLAGDTLTGNVFANTLDGGSGNDTLRGMGGNDALIGGEGVDTAAFTYLTDGRSCVVASLDVNGDGTAHVIAFDGTTSSIVETDTLKGIECLSGSAGADFLSGNASANTLLGNVGDDHLSGGGGKDTIDGGAGSNTANYDEKTLGLSIALNDAGKSIVYVGGVVEDTLTNIQNLNGGSAADTLKGNVAVNVLNGGDGDDSLSGGGGFDTLDGGFGSDTADYSADTGGVRIDLSAANLGYVTATTLKGIALDKLYSIENLTGGSAGDTLTGDVFNNRLIGGAGFDALAGGDGDDVLIPGAGGGSVDGGGGYGDAVDFSDQTAGVQLTLIGGDDNATFYVGGSPVNGTRGSAAGTVKRVENIIGGSAGDKLTGDDDGQYQGNRIEGRGGDDALYGGGGNDHLVGGVGKDFLDGGDNSFYRGDTADYSDKTLAISVTLTGAESNPSLFAKVSVGGVEEDTLVRIEDIIGGSGNDTITDGDTASLNGGTDNAFFGGVGADVLNGGRGDDVLQGGAGKDRLDGGDGGDSFGDYANYQDKSASQSVTVTLKGSAAAVVYINGVGEDTIKNIENVTGGAGNDRLTGDSGSNTLDGGAGDDYLKGGGGFDYLDGGYSGFDTIDYSSETRDLTLKISSTYYNFLRSGNDYLGYLSNVDKFISGSGNDQLNAGAGLHTFEGGAGNDAFTFDTALSASNITTITDFKSGLDRIEIDRDIFSAWAEGAVGTRVLAANYTEGTSSTTTKAGAQIIYNTVSGALLYDGDGVGGNAALQFATLSQNSDKHLSASDFLIV